MVVETAQPIIELMAGGQWEFVNSDAKHDALFSGRAGGKTVANVVKAFKYVNEHPGALGVLTEPTYTKLRDVLLPCIRKFFGEMEGRVWEFRRGDMEIVFPTLGGAKILLRPAAEADKARGLDLAFFGMDEVAEGYQHWSFVVLQGCLRQEGYPHQGWVVSTPEGSRLWLKRRWLDGVNPATGEPLPAGQYKRHEVFTEDNWHNPADYVENLRASLPSERLVAQELYGQFITIQGAGFPQFDDRIHVRAAPMDMKVKKTVIGVDFGGVVPTACEEFSLMHDGRIQGTWEFYERQCSERALVEALGSRSPRRIVCDPTGKSLIEMLRRYGLPAHPARSNDFGLRSRLWNSRLGQSDGQPGIYLSPMQPNLISEIGALAYYKGRGGMDVLTDRWEPGCDDHAYDAGAYALVEFDPAAYGRPKPSFSLIRKGW